MQIVKNVNSFNLKNFKVPGPQDYNPNYSTIDGTPQYSIGTKLKDLSKKWIKSVPGPGSYSTIELVKNNDKILVSNF